MHSLFGTIANTTYAVFQPHSISTASSFNIKTCTTTTTTGRQRIIHNLKLAPYQLHSIIDLTPFQQLQTRPIHHHLRLAAIQRLENRIVVVHTRFWARSRAGSRL